MQIPKKLKIGGHLYTVRQLPGWQQDGTVAATEDSNKNEITLDSEMSQSRKESKFLHEIMHVLNWEMDHALLDSLAEQLYQVLNDNKMLR